jgi:hypothetical protein
MSDLRSRAVVFGVTSGAAVLLAVPVVALAQVPGVVVGGVNQAQDVVRAAPAPPLSLPAPAPAPKPAPAAPAPAPAASAPAPAASAPATAQTRSAPATAPQGSGGPAGTTRAHAASGKHAKADGERSGVRADAAADKDAAGTEATAAQTDTQIANDPASTPRDASPATLPFTGLQLALMLLVGAAAVAAGSVLRRTARA